MTTRLLTLVIAAFALVAPASASAGVVGYDPAYKLNESSNDTYTAILFIGDADDDDFYAMDSGGMFTTGDSSTITESAEAPLPVGCTLVNNGSTHEVQCVTAPDIVVADLGDGPDESNSGLPPGPTGVTQLIFGGPGADVLAGGASDDLLDGGAGNDELYGRAGADVIRGDEGEDQLEYRASDQSMTADTMQAGADEISGGPGEDRLWYDGRTSGVTVTWDGQANDGNSVDTSGDNVLDDVERLDATSQDDKITGGDGAQEVYGKNGKDTIDGGGGADDLDGGNDDDDVRGGAGNDNVSGGPANDRLEGGADSDNIIGDDPGKVGNDQIFARDGTVDAVICGFGADTAQVDANDVLPTDDQLRCETVDRPATPSPQPTASPGQGQPTPTPSSQPTPAPTGTAGPSPGKLTATGPASARAAQFIRGVAITVSTLGAARCTATLKVKRLTQATGKGTALKAGKLKVLLKAKKGKRVRKGKGTVTVSCTDASGRKATANRSLTVK